MLQVSSISAGYNNISYGNKTKVVSKTISNTAQKTQPAVKKAISLGGLFGAIFGAKKVAETKQPETKKPTKNGYREERIYDKKGNLTNILKYSNADDVLSMNVSYDVKTGKPTQTEFMRKDGITTQYVETYDKNGKKDKLIGYDKNANKVRWVEFYNKREDRPQEVTWYRPDGTMEEQVHLDEATGNITNRFKFAKSGNLKERSETAAITGNIIKTTKYKRTGDKIVQEFDIVSGEPTNTFYYDKNHRLVDWKISDGNNERSRYFLSHVKNKKEDDFDYDNKKSKVKELSDKDQRNIAEFLVNRYEMEHAE